MNCQKTRTLSRGRESFIGHCCGTFLTSLSWILIIVTMPWSLCMCVKIVNEYERAVIFRLGRLLSGQASGPGIFFIIPCTDEYTKVDLRTVSFDVPPQEGDELPLVQGQLDRAYRDSVTVAVDAIVYYRIENATISVTKIENAHHSTRSLAQTTLRNVLGTKSLSAILSDREHISHMIQADSPLPLDAREAVLKRALAILARVQADGLRRTASGRVKRYLPGIAAHFDRENIHTTLDGTTQGWGVKVERVEMKDVRLPKQLQRAMAAEAEADRESRAKVIAANGERDAASLLRKAADVMDESHSALQLRYLDTMSQISSENNSTILFPMPIDMLGSFGTNY